MNVPLVMTVLGRDRTGLVESLARVVAAHGGNWLESRMCRLGGEFAGLLRIHVPEEQRANLEKALGSLPDVTVVTRLDQPVATGPNSRLASLDVVGHDRPGIVCEISRTLASQGVNLEQLTTECLSAPMSGEPLFQARARLLLPPGLKVGDLLKTLERVGTDLTIEISLLELDPARERTRANRPIPPA
jgi:glycine cleavage system regulatory protein